MAVRKRQEVGKGVLNNDAPLAIEIVPMDAIAPHPLNAREHDETNIQAIVKSLQSFGQRTPIVIGNTKDEEGRSLILKGNGTYEALRRIGVDSAQIVRVGNLSEAEEQAYSIADNKTSDLSVFDFRTLSDVMRHLQGEGINLETTGFQSFEIEPLLLSEWKQSPVGESGSESDGSVKITFTHDQAEVIRRAIAKYGKASMLEGIVALAEDTLMGTKKLPPKKKEA